MKKNLLALNVAVIMFCCTANAQLKVLTNGNVGVGDALTPLELLQVGERVNADISVGSSTQNKAYMGTWMDKAVFSVNRSVAGANFANPGLAAAEIELISNNKDSYIGFYTFDKNGEAAPERMRIDKVGKVGIGTIPYYDLDVMGHGAITSRVGTYSESIVRSWVSNSVFGYALGVDANGNGGIYGDLNRSTAFMLFNTNGNVGIGCNPDPRYTLHISGGASTDNGIWHSSDKRFKTNINPIENSLEKVMKMNGVSYEFKLDEFPDRRFYKGLHLGFIAQDLKEILPEVVKEDEDGYLAVNYEQVIPVLVEAIKEQNEKIKSLETQISWCCTEKQRTNNDQAINTSMPDTKALLMQNNPNPFNQRTSIGYYLPPSTTSASLMIFDLQGVLLKVFPVTQFGKGTVEIDANELSAGMFIYSLISDGKEIDTKKMILTK